MVRLSALMVAAAWAQADAAQSAATVTMRTARTARPGRLLVKTGMSFP